MSCPESSSLSREVRRNLGTAVFGVLSSGVPRRVAGVLTPLLTCVGVLMLELLPDLDNGDGM
jgi:hypothetical protein